MTITTILPPPSKKIKSSKIIKANHYPRLIDSDLLYKAKKKPSKLTSKEKKVLKAFLGENKLEDFFLEGNE